MERSGAPLVSGGGAWGWGLSVFSTFSFLARGRSGLGLDSMRGSTTPSTAIGRGGVSISAVAVAVVVGAGSAATSEAIAAGVGPPSATGASAFIFGAFFVGLGIIKFP